MDDEHRLVLLQHNRRVDKIILIEIRTNDANTACFLALALREHFRSFEELLGDCPNYIEALCYASDSTVADLVPRIQLELLTPQLLNAPNFTPWAMACYLCEIRLSSRLSLEPSQILHAYEILHPEQLEIPEVSNRIAEIRKVLPQAEQRELQNPEEGDEAPDPGATLASFFASPVPDEEAFAELTEWLGKLDDD